MLSKRLFCSALFSTVVLSWAVAASATTKIPKVVNFQGYLTDNTGTPINGTRNLRFRLYDMLSGGSSLNWSETHNNVSIVNGVYNVILGGTGTPARVLDETFRRQYFLQIEVDHTGGGAWETLSPRHALTNATYALASRKVVYQQMLTVAADGGDTTTVSGALDMLMGNGAFSSALAPAPSASSPWVIEVQAGQYNEPGTFGGGGNIAVPNWVTIRGRGWNATQLINVNSIVMTGTGQGLESLMLIPNSNATVINMNAGTYGFVREVKIEAMEPTPVIDMTNASFCDVVENHIIAMGPGAARGIITSGMSRSRVEDNYINLNHPALAASAMGSYGISDLGSAMTMSSILENTIVYVTTGTVGLGPSYGIGLSGTGNAQVSNNIFQSGAVAKDIIDATTGNPPAWGAPGVGEHGIGNQHSDGTAIAAF